MTTNPNYAPQKTMNVNAIPFNPTRREGLNLGTLNARSMQNKEKRLDIIHSLVNQHQLVAITETWLPYSIQQEFPSLNVMQSSFGKHRQVALVADNTVKVTPVFPDLWNDCMLSARIQGTSQAPSRQPFFLVVVYWPPGEQKKQHHQLIAVVEYCRNRNKDMEVVVAGDFNMTRKKMIRIAEGLNLHLAQDPSEELPTHKTTATGTFNQLDFILTSSAFQNTQCTTNNKWSDHNILSTTLLLPSQQIRSNRASQKFEIRLKKNISEEEEVKILSHPDWPRRSFIQIAQVLGLTQKIKINDREDGGTKYLAIKKKKQLQEVMEKTDELLSEYHDKDKASQMESQESTLERLTQLWSSGTAKLYLKCLDQNGSALLDKLMEQIRCRLPKQFFQALKQTLKIRNKATICKAFKREIVNGKIVHPESVKEYLENLFHSNRQTSLEPIAKGAEYLEISTEEVKAALDALHNRATGVDGLPAMTLKKPRHQELLVSKLTISMSSWLKNHKLPSYLKRGKLLNLSKEETAYPSHGAMRSISMGTSVTKMLEHIILGRLKQEVAALGLIHPKQRGFQEGKNTLQNIEELVEHIQRAKSMEQGGRRKKIPVALRKRQFIFFIDLKRAFDSVDKNMLLRMLRQKGISAATVNAIQTVIDRNSLQLDGQVIDTNIGVPQGSKLSPMLFVLYINDLIEDLNSEGNSSLAFADDIVVVSESKHALAKAVHKLEQWSLEFQIAPNPKKSAIMAVRQDARTPAPSYSTLMGYPVTSSYKYLGVLISDSLQLKILANKIKDINRSFKVAIHYRQASRLPLVAKFQAWSSLYLSRAQYASWYLSTISNTVKHQLVSLYYQGIKTLFQIGQNPQKGALILAASGVTLEQMIESQQQKTLRLIRKNGAIPKQKDLFASGIKQMVKLQASHFIKYLSHSQFQFSKKQSQLRQCHCGQIMSQQHLNQCPRLEKYWAIAAKAGSLRSGRNLKLQISKSPQRIHNQRKVLPLLTTAMNTLMSKLYQSLAKPDSPEVPRQPPAAQPTRLQGRKRIREIPQPKQKTRQTQLYDYFRPIQE